MVELGIVNIDKDALTFTARVRPVGRLRLDPRTALVLADALAFAHLLFVLFVVGGQVLILFGWWRGWRWTRRPLLRWLHLAAMGFVLVQTWFGEPCPLTVWENELRAQAGAPGYTRGFIADFVRWLLYYDAPQWVFTLLYTLFGALLLATFLWYPPRKT